MKLTLALFFLSCCVALINDVSAQPATVTKKPDYFVCRSGNRTITADIAPPECANQEVRGYSRSGLLVTVIEAPLTPEQRQQREMETKRREDEEKAQATRRRLDVLLMQIYPTLESLELARSRNLQDDQTHLASEQKQWALAQKNLTSVSDEVRRFQTKYPDKKVPLDLKLRFDDLTRVEQQHATLVTTLEKRLKKTNERFDADRARWLELKNSGKF